LTPVTCNETFAEIREIAVKPYETLLLQQIDHVLVVTLNRPHSANALNLAMTAELVDLLSELYLDAGQTRCVVLTGAGDRIFCAGGDMKERRTMMPEDVRRQRGLMEQLISHLHACSVPIVAAVNGAAVGGGCELVAAVDFAYGAETAKFSLPEVKLGISPGAGGTQTMPRACGVRRAMAQAYEWGLLNKVLPADELMSAALEVAQIIAANAPTAVRQAKKAVAVATQTDLATGFRFEIEAHGRTTGTLDRQEAIAAFSEKRTPIFRGE
jgi:enoyl-CoA hydratase/carnithine racemase